MLLSLAVASLCLAFLGTIGLVIIATRRVVVIRQKRQAAETRLTAPALAVAFEDDAKFPALSKRDAVTFARLLGQFSARLQGSSRERIAKFFEREGHVRDTIEELSDQRPWRRAKAAYSLGDMASRTAVVALVGAVSDRNRDVRAAATRSLGQLGAAEAIEPLVAALASALIPRGVVGHAILALGPQAVPRLIPLLTHADPQIRATVAELIGHLGDARDAEYLIEALADRSAAVRERSASALGRLGASGAYEGLTASLRDGAPPVRAAAAEALGLIGNILAWPALIAVASEDSFEPARAASQALGRINPELLRLTAEQTDVAPFISEAAAIASLGSIGS